MVTDLECFRATVEHRRPARVLCHIEAGVDILNPLQPECLDVDAVYEQYGDRLSFDGCIGTQSTMPWGTPDDVRARVDEVIGKYGQDGGLIISPTHVLEPEVPLENIDALFDACREYGRDRGTPPSVSPRLRQ